MFKNWNKSNERIPKSFQSLTHVKLNELSYFGTCTMLINILYTAYDNTKSLPWNAQPGTYFYDKRCSKNRKGKHRQKQKLITSDKFFCCWKFQKVNEYMSRLLRPKNINARRTQYYLHVITCSNKQFY